MEAGKSVLINDKDLNSDILQDTIESLLANNMEKYVNMKEANVNKAPIESEAIIVEKILGVV